MQRHFSRSPRLTALALGTLGGVLFAGTASAQVSGTSAKPLPDVLLLVDTSGSMERMVDGTTPESTPANTCVPGTYSNPNRWGMLVQALTGNVQPYFSCFQVPRAGADFANRYGINGNPPYDANYVFDYHQPTSGGTSDTACAVVPWYLPGAPNGQGVGINKYATGSINASDYPTNALASVLYNTIRPSGAYAGGITVDSTTGIPATNSCTFTQGNDGQLDATKFFARFALMTFDSDPYGETGLGATSTSTDATTNGIYVNSTAASGTTPAWGPFTGQWSYLRSAGNPDATSARTDTTTLLPTHVVGAAEGRPGTTPACTFSDQEVGARNEGAPPWEGRLIDFPSQDATVYEMDSQNNNIQQTLIATRPSGATPLDGMVDDARDYYWYKTGGPKDDAYTCRERYIIILTDGAPNLDLRPSCATQPNGVCPYGGSTNTDNAGTMALDLYNGTNGQKVITYVVGFAVSGDSDAAGSGFPGGLLHNDCKTWFETMSGSTPLAQATSMQNACLTSPPPVGSTADACCKLNNIAFNGGQRGAFFAESQADIVLAFGDILADIIHSASTKTTPVFSPAVAFSANAIASSSTATAGTTAQAAEFIASYIPNAERPWSGEIDRTRFLCDGTNHSNQQPESDTTGDSEAENLAYQSAHDSRTIITVIGQNTTSAVDSQASIRPFADQSPASSTNGDLAGAPGGGATYTGQELAMTSYSTLTTFADPTNWPLALNVTANTCQRGRSVKVTGGTDVIPALHSPTECSEVVWGFATAAPTSMKFADADPTLAAGYEFNIRCINGSSAASGTCSITGGACATNASTCPTGEVCVPNCSALGAVYHSTPAILPPPQSLLREDGFRAYQQNRATRQTVMFAASTDGILHAFKALDSAASSDNHELWSFVPPAVLPQLSSNYPNGNEILLDGPPVVRETVWDRLAGNTSAAASWHATLVASFGSFGGYYAVNVTDADCNGSSTECRGTGFQAASDSTLPQSASGADMNGDSTSTDPSTKDRGPHFLWQLTDIPTPTGSSTENAVLHRTSPIGNTKMAALFGKNTGTPAVGMVDIKDSSGADHQIGIAILPGGYENPPQDPTKYFCPRRVKAPSDVYADPLIGYRTNVRQWAGTAAADCDKLPVPGRGVTIVRLDNGEIIKHFGRMTSGVPQDAPLAIAANVIDTPFDSPMIGVPVVYPDQVGVPIQKVFVGDADGTLWRIDLTSTDPNGWHANLFADLIAPAGKTSAVSLSQPIYVPPALSTTDGGDLVVNVATGDQESIVVSTDVNYLYSITELRDGSSPPHPVASTNWFNAFGSSERVTGPMVVFDKTLYFATYLPQHPSGDVCTALGTARLWGLDYVIPNNTSVPANGAIPKWCPAGSTDLVTGLCATGVTLINFEAEGSDIIPGVALQAAQACVSDVLDDYGNTSFQSITNASYSLSFGIAKPNATGSMPPQAARNSLKRALPQTQTRIDSWSIVTN